MCACTFQFENDVPIVRIKNKNKKSNKSVWKIFVQHTVCPWSKKIHLFKMGYFSNLPGGGGSNSSIIPTLTQWTSKTD